jgi:molybdopterin-guanine dinucleotide biosynthesis protein B
MYVIGLCGFSGSGKTTLAERLIRHLRDAGLRVSVVKHAHHAFDIDQPGKDSWRHRQAGAFEVVIASDRRLAKMREFESRADPGVHDLVAELAPCDWVIVEGFKRAELPKLEVWRASNSKPARYPDDRWVVAIATDDPVLLPVPTALPVLDLDDSAAIAAFLLAQSDRFRYRAPALRDPAPAGAVPVPVLALRGGRTAAAETHVADEVPVTIEIDGQVVATMMATPADLDDLVLGHLLTEGGVGTASDLAGVETLPGAGGIRLVASLGDRASRPLAKVDAPRRIGAARLAPSALAAGMQALAAGQDLWRATGSNHAAAWLSMAGELVLVREDIGRRNALDKLVGAMARAGVDPADGFVAVTSRVSHEMVAKAVRAGIGVLAAISAPTRPAIRLAEASGMVLIGFARGDAATVYSHPERMASTTG